MISDDVSRGSSSAVSPGDPIDSGSDLESGLLARAREWIDLFPWLRLFRALRAAGSPPLLLLTALVFALWLLGMSLIVGDRSTVVLSVAADQNAILLADYVRSLVPTSLLDTTPGDRAEVGRPISGWSRLFAVLWSIFLWTPSAMLLTRQGALLTAGRSLAAFGPGVSLAVRRAPAGWLAAAVPLLCILPLVAVMIAAGWVSTWFAGMRSLEIIAAVFIAILALPCGLLAFGANVAIPISWAALMNERDSDPLDALSRGYEYLLRRPVQLICYAAISLSLLVLIGLLASAVTWSASGIADSALAMAGGSEELRGAIDAILWRFPVVVVLVLLWSLIGGIYLLLRYDAGSQEVEDLWQPSAAARPSLPELRN